MCKRSSIFLLPFLFLVCLTEHSLAGPGSVPRQKATVAVVLSGGGARGGAHIGALRRLEEAGVPIDLIVGTSIGALVGGLYAVGYSTDDIELIVNSLDWNVLLDDTPDRQLMNYDGKKEVDRNLLRLQVEGGLPALPTGFSGGQKIRQLLDRLTSFRVLEAGNDFDRLPIPFRAVATDLLTGEAHVFKDGSLSVALRASMAVPGLFTPVDLGETLLVDGGIADNLAVDVALDQGADVVIAVDVSTPIRSSKDQVRSLFDVLDQTISFHIEENKVRSRQLADVVITPEIEGVNSGDFPRLASLIEPGFDAVADRLEDVKKALSMHSLALKEQRRRENLLRKHDGSMERADQRQVRILPDVVRIEGAQDGAEVHRFFGDTGQSVSAEEMNRRVSELFGTNRFDRVGYRLEKVQDQTVLTYELDPSAKTTVGLGIRYDLDYHFTGAVELASRKSPIPGAEWRFRGMIGDANGALFRLDARPSPSRSFRVSSEGYYSSLERQLFTGSTAVETVEDERSGFMVGAGFLLGNRGMLEGRYRLEGLSGAKVAVFPQSDRKVLSGFEVAFGLDTFDRAYFPDTGSAAHVGVEFQDRSLGSDASFWKVSADLERVFSLGQKTTLGLLGTWGLVDGDEIPYLERFFAGGVHYLSVSAGPFIGLERDQRVSLHQVVGGLTLRHRVKSIPLGFVRVVYVGAKYQAGLFNRGESVKDFHSLLHGLGLGLYLDSAFLGPLSFEVGGTNEDDVNIYFSVGHRF